MMRARGSIDARPTQRLAGAAAEVPSEAVLRALVETVAVPRSYHRERDTNREIAAWIAERLGELGLDVELQGVHNNVVARSPACRRRPAILIGAHYDSIPGCPGADDNASAVAALLAVAELLTRRAPDAPWCFVAFNLEEEGLLGSTDFVEQYLPASGLEIRMAHILEMVGYTDSRPGVQRVPAGLPKRVPDTADFLALIASRDSHLGARRVLTLARRYLPELKVISMTVSIPLEFRFPILMQSDHASFWREMLPAVLWNDTSHFRNPHYHERTDTPDTLDYTFLRRVTQLLYLACLDAAAT